MPDQNNKLIISDLELVLQKAEINIAKFEPPSISMVSADSFNNNQIPPNIEQIQLEIANKSAIERTSALFDFFTKYIAQISKEEIDQQQLLQALLDIKTRLDTIEETLIRNNLT